MAIFEKTFSNKSIFDDTEKLVCLIENAQNNNKHTEYVLRVQRGPSKENKWHVIRRYRDFAALHVSLQQANIELPLPPKKLIGNMQPHFIAERQIALQKYLDEVLKHRILELSLPVRIFLDPNNYSTAIADQALQTVSIALRGDGRFEMKEPLTNIGWRIRKQHFLVKDTRSGTNCILSWQNYGLDRYLNDKDLQLTLKSLQSLSHPHIDQILAAHSLETGAYVVREIHECGSLRDLLYGTEYTKSYLGKYGNPKVRKNLTLGQISHYGCQILQALEFLHEKGMFHGHVHPGNIAIVDHRAVLMDVENFIIGVPSLYRPFLQELKRSDAKIIDIYCFGRTLYEMAFAEPLNGIFCDCFPYDTPSDLESVLRNCLSSTTYKHGGITIASLLKHQLFDAATINGAPSSRMHFKLPADVKEELRSAVAASEERLKSDQKLLRSTRREVRIKEILSSEAELKKQKKRTKKRDSLYKSTSSLAETVRSHSISDGSSPTPHAMSPETSIMSPTPAASSPQDGRSALLDAICSFDKGRLARINSS